MEKTRARAKEIGKGAREARARVEDTKDTREARARQACQKWIGKGGPRNPRTRPHGPVKTSNGQCSPHKVNNGLFSQRKVHP